MIWQNANAAVENCPVDPNNIQGTHQLISFMTEDHQTFNTRERPTVNLVQLL